MHKKWTGNLVGLMHDHKITKTQLAEELGVSREYVSMVLNEHRTPVDAESRFIAAVTSIIERNNDTSLTENRK